VELCEERYRPHDVHSGGGKDEGGTPDTVGFVLAYVLGIVPREDLRGSRRLHGSMFDDVVHVDRQSQMSDGGAH
jgi:hypothetical protein